MKFTFDTIQHELTKDKAYSGTKSTRKPIILEIRNFEVSTKVAGAAKTPSLAASTIYTIW